MKRFTIITLVAGLVISGTVLGMNDQERHNVIDNLAQQIFDLYDGDQKREISEEQFTAAKGFKARLNALKTAVENKACRATPDEKKLYIDQINNLYLPTPTSSPTKTATTPTITPSSTLPTPPAMSAPAPAPLINTPDDTNTPAVTTAPQLQTTPDLPNPEITREEMDALLKTTKPELKPTTLTKISVLHSPIFIGVVALSALLVAGTYTYWHQQKTKKADATQDATDITDKK